MRKHTPRHEQIITLILMGKSNAEIAEQLHVKVATVSNHINRLYLMYGLEHEAGTQKRVQLAVTLYQERHGIMDPMMRLLLKDKENVDLGNLDGKTVRRRT